ncbi:MAG: hypothetical protein MUO34_03770, partial [Ignavibacteriaceae bacterium]|nr:hypothetical protein [Ignavibacteriaceae bacterium]
MKKSILKAILFFILIGFANSNSQTKAELDSLYNLFLNVKGLGSKISPDLPTGVEENLKCGLNLVNTLRFNIDSFSPEQQELLKVLFQRPVTTDSMITPSGRYKIHYYQTGTDAPAYDLNLLAIALDSVYKFEIEFLGYGFPPGDSLYDPNGDYGGDNKYDIYIMNLYDLYGYTQFEVPVQEVQQDLYRYTSYMVIDNDYPWYPFQNKQPIDAARVTVAHEFHHAIQGGNYILRLPEDLFFYEITSTAMEEFVFDSINDYYAYIPDYFRNPSRAFPNNNGYNLAHWNIYIRDIFGYNIIKRQWELMKTNRALSAINNSIQEYTSVFEFELARFGIWNYFTNYRSISGAYFEEARNYPVLIPTVSTVFSPPSRYYEISSFPVSNYYMRMVNSSNNDTIVSIFANTDVLKALNTIISPQVTYYTLFSDTLSGDYNIGDSYSATFDNNGNAFWKLAEIVNNIPLTGDSIIIVKKSLANILPFPLPY